MNKMSVWEVLKSPVVTEKSVLLKEATSEEGDAQAPLHRVPDRGLADASSDRETEPRLGRAFGPDVEHHETAGGPASLPEHEPERARAREAVAAPETRSVSASARFKLPQVKSRHLRFSRAMRSSDCAIRFSSLEKLFLITNFLLSYTCSRKARASPVSSRYSSPSARSARGSTHSPSTAQANS